MSDRNKVPNKKIKKKTAKKKTAKKKSPNSPVKKKAAGKKTKTSTTANVMSLHGGIRKKETKINIVNRLGLEHLKKEIIRLMFQHCHTFFIHCMPTKEFKIGGRGFVRDEKKYGIILVFGSRSYRNLRIDNSGIFCQLQFQKWEDMVIPFSCIRRIFDKVGMLMMQWASATPVEKKSTEKKGKVADSEMVAENLQKILRGKIDGVDTSLPSEAAADSADLCKKMSKSKKMKPSNLIAIDFTKKKTIKK